VLPQRGHRMRRAPGSMSTLDDGRAPELLDRGFAGDHEEGAPGSSASASAGYAARLDGRWRGGRGTGRSVGQGPHASHLESARSFNLGAVCCIKQVYSTNFFDLINTVMRDISSVSNRSFV
jgi:hypothetical protein